jgi:hypothetical protein
VTLTAAESRKNVMASIFRRKGRDGIYTRLFDNLDPVQHSTLLDQIQLNETEVPVIGSVEGPGNWLVLTTERLVWSIDGKREEVAANIICDATADFRQLQRSKRSKLEMRQLQILTMTGVEYSIELEPGAPLIGVWHVLKNLGTRNRNALKAAALRRGADENQGSTNGRKTFPSNNVV